MFDAPVFTYRDGQQKAQVQNLDVIESLTFDITSIRPSDPQNTTFGIDPDPNNLSMTGIPLNLLIQRAYHLHSYQLVGVPQWVRNARFDIHAKMEEPGTTRQTPKNPMSQHESERLLEARLRSLLVERFGLLAHTITKTQPQYALRIFKQGVHLRQPDANADSFFSPSEIRCGSASMSDLAQLLSDVTDRVVTDETQLDGYFAFSLKWKSEQSASSDDAEPSLFTALKEQLGLQLVQTKGMTEVLIVDRIEMPSPN